MKLITTYFSFFFLMLVSGCEKNLQEKANSQPYISTLDLREDLEVLTSKMTDQDTIVVEANLTMEYWVRTDHLVISKNKNSIVIEATVEEDTTFERKFQMKEIKLPRVEIRPNESQLEDYFSDNLKRTNSSDQNDNNWIYKIINQSDTLIFYTYGLGDRGGVVGDYFQLMQEFYPNAEEFKPIEVINEPERNENPR